MSFRLALEVQLGFLKEAVDDERRILEETWDLNAHLEASIKGLVSEMDGLQRERMSILEVGKRLTMIIRT